MERLTENEIIISIYDSAVYWTILRIKNGRTYKTNSNYKNLGTIEQQIYDSQLLMWRNDITTKVLLKKLQENGYNKITICEDGDIMIYENCVRKV